MNPKSKLYLLPLVALLMALPIMLSAQQKPKTKKTVAAAKGPEDFPELVFTEIPGAPKLIKPKLIKGRIAPVRAEGMGWAAPAVYDWDGDGKKDLLIGEFGSGMKNGESIAIGSYVRVYQNEGTAQQPAFSGVYNYAHGRMDKDYYGTPLSVYTWCCQSFIPRFADLDNDGYQDMITGQYNPGFVTWFRGSEEGFCAGQRLDQYGDPMDADNNGTSSEAAKKNQKSFTYPITDALSFNYWTYSAVDFGDFDGDGDLDMIVGGGALRISENIGNKTTPKFGLRKLLLDINEKPLSVNRSPLDTSASLGGTVIPCVADWDNDGMLDLLVTTFYAEKDAGAAVTFFKGLKTAKGLRFQTGVPLFSAKDGGKAFPGSVPNVCVADWNNDGINDLIIGSSVTTMNGKFDHKLSWSWEEEMEVGTFKLNPANESLFMRNMIKNDIERAEAERKKLGWTEEKMRQEGKSTKKGILAQYYGKPEYMNMAHQGYVYVMLGRK